MRAQAVGEAVATDAVDQADHLLLGGVAAGDEASQVHLHNVGHADVVDQDVPDIGHLLTLAEQPYRRTPDPLLVALGGLRRERAHDHPTHVHHVGRQPDPPDQITFVEDRLLDHDVLGVQPSAVVRVVGEEHVARGHRVAEARDRRLHRVRRRPEMEQDHPRADDQIALRIHNGDREVLGLGDGG